MLHYLLTLSTQNIGPFFPQCIKMAEGYNLQGDASVWRLGSCYNQLPDFTPNLDSFVLQADAIPTDVISNMFLNESIGLLISDRFWQLLQNYRLPTHQVYPAKVVHADGQSAGVYHWLHWGSSALPWINWQQSTFMIETLQGRAVSLLELNSIDEFSQKSRGLPLDQGIVIKEIALKKQITEQSDLFKIGLGDIGIYLSESLHSAIKGANISGIQTVAADRLTFS